MPSIPPPSVGSSPLIGLVLSAAVMSVAGPVSGQASPAEWATLEQRVEVSVTGGSDAVDVVVHFLFGSAVAGAPLPLSRPIPLELLGFGAASAEEFEVEPGGAVVLWPTVGSHRAAVVHAPPEATGEGWPLTVRYRIEDAHADAPGDAVVHMRVPMLTGPPVRAEAGGDAFQARIALPDGWVPREGFPSGLQADGNGDWAVELTVAPSVVSFRARTDGRWRPGFPHAVDLLTVIILGGFAAFGWRHLRSLSA